VEGGGEGNVKAYSCRGKKVGGPDLCNKQVEKCPSRKKRDISVIRHRACFVRNLVLFTSA